MLAAPPPSYCNISRLVSTLLAHCEKHNITIWPEYGTLLGWARHDNIIAWDYDADFGVFAENKDKLLATFRAEHPEHIMLDEAYYSDTGCLALHDRDNRTDIVDVIFYRHDGAQLRSTQSAQILADYPCPYNYCYNLEWIFPLTRDTLLGHQVWIPVQVGKLLAMVYGEWRDYPPEFRNYIQPKFLTPPYQAIPEFENLPTPQLLAKLKHANEPVIVREAEILKYDVADYQSLISGEKGIFGYTSSVTWDYVTLEGHEVWNRYQAGKLDMNIVDAPVTHKAGIDATFLTQLNAEPGSKLDTFSVCWVLTNAPKVTHFHRDPAYGGGYMKLLEGCKIWWCVLDADAKYLEDHGHSYESLSTLDLLEILTLENYYLWGKIYVSILAAGDFLWFPKLCLHKVITVADSHGFGGYI